MMQINDYNENKKKHTIYILGAKYETKLFW